MHEMSSSNAVPAVLRIALCLGMLICLPGCPDGVVPGAEDGNVDPDATSPFGRTRGEPNNDFDMALIAVFTDGTASLQGTISAPGDVDLYDIGPQERGNRIVVDVDTIGDLDSMAVIFDEQGRLFAQNDDVNLQLGLFDSFIDEVVRWDGARYYVGISDSPFAPGTGSYRIEITVTPGQLVPPPQQQVLFLDFDGGDVLFDNSTVERVQAFDAGDVHPIYDGQSETIKRQVIATVAENFEGFDIIILNSDDDPPPPDGLFSTVFFGGYDSQAHGIAQSIDAFNADQTDSAIIYTETFTPHMFSSPPSSEELGVAIGNIATHEAGHLLGLVHVEDPTAIMDAASPADTFLLDQEFRESPLHDDVFPIGDQDAALLLAEILGLL